MPTANVNKKSLKHNEVIKLIEEYVKFLDFYAKKCVEILENTPESDPDYNQLIIRAEFLKQKIAAMQYEFDQLKEEELQQQSAPLVFRM